MKNHRSITLAGWELIQKIDFSQGGQSAKILLTNGDALQGTFEFNALGLGTVLGNQSIPLSLIKSITTQALNIDRGLVLHYSLTSLADTCIVDQSGNDNDGVMHGAPVKMSKSSPYVEFDGRRNFIQCKSSMTLNLQGGLSILAWLEPKSWGNRQSNGIVSKKEDDYSNGYVLYNNGYYPEHLNLRIRGTAGTADMMHSRARVDVGVLQQWAVTYDAAAKEIHFYKDGTLDTTYTSVVVGNMSNDLPLQVGHTQTWGGYFIGSLGNVMIYDRALSTEEVRKVYDAQKSLAR